MRRMDARGQEQKSARKPLAQHNASTRVEVLQSMTKRTAILISNPNAGRTSGASRRAQEVARFCKLLRPRGIEIEVLHTARANDAARFAERAASEGATDVIVSGGDGTINEALQGLIGKDVRLAIWPRGTANVLARELDLPFDVERIAQMVARGKAQRAHVGCATALETGETRYFFLMAGIGLDASVVRSVHPGLKRRAGEAAFWYAGLAHLARWPPPAFTLEVDGQSFPATFAVIGKGARYGGNLSITPRARLDQPDFEICIVDSHSRMRYLHLLTHAMRKSGLLADTSGVKFLRATQTRAIGNAMVQVDGELIGRLPMRFEIAPHSINLIIP